MKEKVPEYKQKQPFDYVIEKLGIPDLVSRLNDLPPNDLQTILLKVFDENVKNISPIEVMNRYNDRYRYLGGSEIDQRNLINFDSLLYSIVPDSYSAIEFSPTGPLGTNAVLAKISQDNIPSTIRNTEVMSDPTVMLALEAARRRRYLLQSNSNNADRIRVCTSSRILRLQPFDSKLEYKQHFRAFATLIAGHNDNFNRFLSDSATENISIFLDFIDKLNYDKFSIDNVIVYISNMKIMEHLISLGGMDERTIRKNTQTLGFRPFQEYAIDLPEIVSVDQKPDSDKLEKYGIERSWNFLNKTKETIMEPLQKKYPSVKFAFDLSRHAGIGYYPNFAFHIYGVNNKGLLLQLADGGLTDWTKLLLNNNRELCMSGGFGSELILNMFQKTT